MWTFPPSAKTSKAAMNAALNDAGLAVASPELLSRMVTELL